MKLNPLFGNARLLRLVAPFIAIVLLQAFVAGISMNVLSSVRAYVGGESLWSRDKRKPFMRSIFSAAPADRNSTSNMSARFQSLSVTAQPVLH